MDVDGNFISSKRKLSLTSCLYYKYDLRVCLVILLSIYSLSAFSKLNM